MIKGKYNAGRVIGEMAAIVENVKKKMTHSGFHLMDEGTWVKQIGVKVNGVS